MDDRVLDRILKSIGREEFRPSPDLVCRTKERLRRSPLLPWVVFGSLLLQLLTACVSVFILTTDALSWTQKMWALAGGSFLIALFLLPLVAVKDQIGVFWEESDRTVEYC